MTSEPRSAARGDARAARSCRSPPGRGSPRADVRSRRATAAAAPHLAPRVGSSSTARLGGIAGQIGLKEYRCSARQRSAPARASASGLGGAQLSAGSEEGDGGSARADHDPEAAIGEPWMANRHDPGAGLRGERRRARRQRRPGAEEPNRDAVGRKPQSTKKASIRCAGGPNRSRRLRQGITWTPQLSRWRRSSSKSSGEDESSARTVTGQPRPASDAPMASLLPTWPATTMRRPPETRKDDRSRRGPAYVDEPTASSSYGRDGSGISSTT